MRPYINRTVLPALVIGTLAAACDQPESRNPSGPSPATANSVEIVGPSSVPPGTPTQYTANVRLSNGVTKGTSTVSDLRWQISNGLMQVSASGLVTPVATQGEATLTAIFRMGNVTRQSSREIVILPNGTFRVVGRITEAGVATIPVVGARVEVESGSPFAITDSGGNYRLYGVPPSATLRVSAPNYETETVPVQLSANSTRNVSLFFSGQRPNYAGNYNLTIQALGSCGTMPAEFRTRQYQAEVSQSGTALEVTLTAPTFRLSSAGRGNRFSGFITSSGAVFSLTWPDSYYYYYYYIFYSPSGYPNLVEAVSNTRYLVTRGNFTTTGSPGGLSGTTSGTVTLWDANFPGFRQRLLSICSGATSFRLDPR